MSEEEFELLEEVEYEPIKKQRKTAPFMSQYEYAALIAARAAQISSKNGTIPYIITEDRDPITIATEEVKKKLVTLIIRRRLPDGTTEDWRPSELQFPRI